LRPELHFGFAGLLQYANVLQDPLFWKGIIVTFRFVVESVLLSALIGLGVALTLNQPFKGRGAVRALVLLPWAVSEFATGIIWSYLYRGSAFGLFNAILLSLRLISNPITWISEGFAVEAISLAFAWHMAPLAAFFFLANLQFIPKDIYRQARIDGANAFRRFRSITLPYLRYSLMIIAVLTMVYASKTIDIVLTLTGGGPGFESSTLTNIVYVRTFKELKFAYGAAMSWFLIVIVMALVTSTFVIMMRVGRKAR